MGSTLLRSWGVSHSRPRGESKGVRLCEDACLVMNVVAIARAGGGALQWRPISATVSKCMPEYVHNSNRPGTLQAGDVGRI